MSKDSKTLYLIDGFAQLFRAYHAIRTQMTSPVTKEPTNATYGFVGMILKLLRDYDPDYVAVAIDVSGDRGTFRSQLYPEYKANREAPPEDFRPQVERCFAILREIGIPIIGAEGFEADDVIATIAEQFKQDHPDVTIRIVSKDKDLQQLLEQGRVEMFDVHKDECIDEAKLKEDKGITPAQVVDMLALMGDTVDNVPGAKGIGPKTAQQLIAEFGSMHAVLEEAQNEKGRIKGKRRENLVEAAAHLPLSRELVELRRDTPDSDLPLESALASEIKLAALVPLLRELGFSRYQDEVKALLKEPTTDKPKKSSAGDWGGGGLFDQADEGPTITAPEGATYTCIKTEKDLAALVKQMAAADLVAIDTETTSLHPLLCDLCGISVCMKAGEAYYIPTKSPDQTNHLDKQTVLDAMRPVLESDAPAKIGHNLKYDMLVFRQHAIELAGIHHDTMVASYVVDSSRSSHGMDYLALDLLGHTCIPIKELIGSGKNQKSFDHVPLETASIYAAEDADITFQLYEKLLPEVRDLKLDKLYTDVEMPLVAVLAELEWYGIRVDPQELENQAERLRTRIESLREQITDAAPRPFNPDSPKQLSGILFNKEDHEDPGLAIKPLKKTKTGYSTDVEVLEKLAADPAIDSPIPKLIVEYRQLTKLVSTYLVALKEAINPNTKRIHASFHQTVAATGRLSSSDPNLQNIPIRSDVGREIRKAFIAEPGCMLIGADYSQIELRILAHLSRDEALIEAFRSGEDIHQTVAAQIHDVSPAEVTKQQRDGAKMVNFGIVYGVTAYGLARRLAVSNAEAAEIIDQYKARFPGIATFLEKCVAQATTHGYVETMLGRRRPINESDSRNPNRRALAERMAINSVVQGSAADLIKLAMINIHRELPPRTAEPPTAELQAAWQDPRPPKMLLQIHDELVFECPSDHAEAFRNYVIDRMEGAMSLDVPLAVESAISTNWFEGK